MVVERALQVLIVEDNPADTYLIEEAMRAEDPACKTIVVADGDSALQYLSEQRPDIVVLDLNLPRRDGVEVLEFIRAEHHLVGVVVVIFSSSPRDAIVRKAPQADAHIQKPFDLEVFLQVGAKIMTCFREARSSGQR
ncbi:MAG: response regulator [Acidobacteriaceae bacterium]|nr:response regulator [Acidobacteriaceae bacterium]